MREDVKSLPDGKREDLAVASAEVLCFLLSAEPEEAVFLYGVNRENGVNGEFLPFCKVFLAGK